MADRVASRAPTRRALALAAIAMAAVLAALALRPVAFGSERTLVAAFDSATNVVAGLEVRVAGHKVGTIRGVELQNGSAMLDLAIDDDRAWPLPKGTTARLRQGTVIGYAARYVELRPGPESNPPLPDGGLLTRAETESPVELDDVVRILDRSGRRQLSRFLNSGASAFDGRQRQIGRGTSAAAQGLGSLADFVAELGRDGEAIEALVRSGARVTAAVASRERELGDWLDAIGQTYDELEARAEPTIASLERLPDALEATRATLARTERSVGELRALTSDLEPGAARLRSIAPVARATISRLDEVAPLARGTLDRATQATPAIRRLLEVGRPFVEDVGDVARRAAPMVGCLRPYGPELAGWISTWAGLGKNYDPIDHHTRTLYKVTPYPNGTPLTPAQLTGIVPGVDYAFPRPPGLNAGQTWFQPRCGAGEDALDPATDPEARGAGG